MIKCYFLWVTLFMSGKTSSEPRWQIESGSQTNVKSQCTNNCNLLRSRICGDQSCDHGVFREHIFGCDYPDVCPGSNLRQVGVAKECTGSCDRAIEQVELQCPTNSGCRVIQDRFCTDERGCLGQWGQWGEYGRCSAKGIRQRERGCFLADKTTQSIYCKNSLGGYKQTETKGCPTSRNLNNPCPPEPSEGGSDVRARNKQCQCHCANIDDVLQKEILYKKCDEAKTKQGLLPNATCGISKQFQVTCEGNLENRQCAAVDTTFLCNSYLEWGSWGEWVKRDSTKQYRQRHRWCSTNLFPIFRGLGCYRAVKVEEECQDLDASASPSHSNGVDTWVIIVIAILLVVLLVLVVVVCFQIRKRSSRRRKATNKNVRVNEVEMVEKYPNDVFLDDESSARQAAEEREKNGKEDHLQHLTVFQRFQKVSEHLYESISPSKSKLAKQPSCAEESSKREADAADCENEVESKCNEYQITTVSNSLENKSMRKSPMTKRMKARAPTASTKHPLRISVTITNPDGKQVGKDVFKSKLQPVSVAKDTQQSEQTKKRWSRVPTPEAMKKNTFFETEEDASSGMHRVHVQSVKYGTPDDVKDHTQSNKSPNNDRYGLRKFLQKLKKPAQTNIHKSRQYDQVPKEDLPGPSKKSTKIAYPYQMPVSSRKRNEEDPMWSESTFDDEISPPLNSLNKPTTSVGQVYQKDRTVQSKNGNSHTNFSITYELPPPPPELLTPNTDVRSPMHHRWSDQSVHDVVGSRVFKSAASANSSTSTLKKSGYLDISAASEDRYSSSEKSSVKPGPPPLPKKPSDKMKPVVLLSLDGSPQREVDPKYVTHVPLKTPIRSPRKSDLPLDRYGYLDLNCSKYHPKLEENC